MKLTKNYRVINEMLTSSGSVPVHDLRTLGRDGYDAVINLLPNDNTAAVPNEQAIIEAQGIAYYYIPVDWQRPMQDDFAQFCTVMDLTEGAINAVPRKRHIHCAANYRASAFYAAYAIKKGLWTEGKGETFLADIWDIAKYPVWSAFWKEMVHK